MLKQISLCIAMVSMSASASFAQSFPDPFAQDPTAKEKSARELKKNHITTSDKWPTNFPMPVYTSNVLQKSFSYSTKGKPTATAGLLTSDQPKLVFEFYKTACSRGNWQVKYPSDKALADASNRGDMFMLTADRDKESLTLSCTKNKSINGTVVSVSWQKNK